MGRIHQYDEARSAREPITLRFPRGRTFEFPPDINSGAFLDFQREHGSKAFGRIMPAEVVRPFYDMLFGDQLDAIKTELTLDELRWAAGELWMEYMGIAGRSPGDEETTVEVAEDPPSPASPTSSSKTSGRRRRTSTGTTGSATRSA